MAAGADATDVAASLTSLLTRLQALPLPTAAAPAHSLTTALPALAAQMGQLNESARPTSLPSHLHASLSSILRFIPSNESEDLVRLAWGCTRTVVEWVVEHKLASAGSGGKEQEQGEGDGGERKEWEGCLKGLLQEILDHLERTEAVDSSGGTAKDQPYRTLVASILSPTLVKLVIPNAADEKEGRIKKVLDGVPDLAKYTALDIFNELLSKHAPNKALARQILPAASLASLLRSSTDFHLSHAAMEIAYRTVPPFNPKSSSTASDNPKKQWIDQLFPVDLFGTDAQGFRERFYKLRGATYYEEMPEILKLISLANIERSQPFMVHSLVYNNVRTLISTNVGGETEIWFCPRSILGILSVPNEHGEWYDERLHIALGDVRAIEIEDGPEGDEDSIVIEMVLKAPPHLGNVTLTEQMDEEGHGKLVMKTTRRGTAFEVLKKTMEERAWRYPALTPHLTSSGTSTSSRPTILRAPPPGAHQSLLSDHSKKPRSSQAGPIVGFFKDPPPVNGDLETPVFVEEESETMRRGKVLAAMAELNEELGSELSKGAEAESEEEEGVGVGVGELVSGQVVREDEEQGDEGEAMEVQQQFTPVQLEIDAGEMSSNLSSIEDSDEEEVVVKVKANPPKSRQPSKTTSNRKSTAAKSVVVSVGPPPSPIKRRSPRLSPKLVAKKEQERSARNPTESIEEESLDRAMLEKPKRIVDEIVEADSESLPKQLGAPHPSSHEIASNAPKQKGEKRTAVIRPKRGNSKPKEAVVVTAEPAAVPLKPKKTKRARASSPAPIPVPLAHVSPIGPHRPKTKTTIVDQPSYPKRRRITDPSPVDEGAPYETTLEDESKSSEGRYTLQENKKSGVPTPRKKYGRERKERKVTEGLKLPKGRGKGKGKKGEGKKVEEESQSENEQSEVEKELASVTKGEKKTGTKKPITDFDSLPHVKTQNKGITDTLNSKTLEKTRGSKDDTPVSASTTKSTKSAASRSIRGVVDEDTTISDARKKAGAKSKKAETFSQLVATPPSALPQRSSSPLAAHRISQIEDSNSQGEKFDCDFGPDIAVQRPPPRVQHPPTPVTADVQRIQLHSRVDDVPKSTEPLPLDPALDPSFVTNTLGGKPAELAPPVVVKTIEQVQVDEHQEPFREKDIIEDIVGQTEVEKESPAAGVEVEVEGEEEQPRIAKDGTQAMVVDKQLVPRAQSIEDSASGPISSPVKEQQEQQRQEIPDKGLRLGDHVLGPTPIQAAPHDEEQLQEFPIAEEELVVDLTAEIACDESAEEGLQAPESDFESTASHETRGSDGDGMVIDGAGEDSGFFAAKDDEVLAVQEQLQQNAALALELVPNTSSLPQPSSEQPTRRQLALGADPVLQRSPQLTKSTKLLHRASGPLPNPIPLRPTHLSLLAHQGEPRGNGGIFSPPRPALKPLVPPHPRRCASSEPPSGRSEGSEGSPRARTRNYARHSDPEPRTMKAKQGRSRVHTGRKKSGRKSRGKGKERERAVYPEEEQSGGSHEPDNFEQEVRAQLDEMVNYIVLKAQARRLASAHALDTSKRRIQNHFIKGAESMHQNTVAVAFTAREQVEQLKSASVKLAALRDRQREANRAIEAEL